MARRGNTRADDVSRRDFLVTTGGALAGLAAFGLADRAAASTRHPQRKGTLQYGPNTDVAGVDPHLQNQNQYHQATAAIYNGLTDIDQQGNNVPSLAESWESNKELTEWTFRLRKGVVFHNGRELDAEAVKLNILRIQDPAIGHEFLRGALDTIERVEVLDKHTIRLHAIVPNISLPTSVMRYPTVLVAPDAFETAATHPIGTGPFKFVSWTRWNETKLVRNENYWETDAEGNQLPYLDEIIVKPKREDSVRLTALRTGQVQLINTMAQADVERFKQSYGERFNTWSWTQGGNFVVFNFRRGQFLDKRLRTAAAHAIDRNAVHHAVYYGQGHMQDQPYGPGDPWHLEGIRSPEYDPDRAKAILKEARASGTAVKLVVNQNLTVHRETAQVIQDLWSTVGFKVTLEPLDTVPYRNARNEGTFDAMIQGNTYRYDPDDYFWRNLHSKSDYSGSLSGWKNERYDQLIDEAKRTREPAKRKELYTEGWNIVTVELPFYYLHDIPQVSAAVKELRGYQPGSAGALSYQGGGLRTAYIAT